MKTLLTYVVTFLLIVSCDSTSIKNTSGQTDSKEYSQELVGQWIQPIPGQDSLKQGFELKSDNSAESINTNTMKYSSWELSKDTLFMSGNTQGVAVESTFIDTLLIVKLSESELVTSYLRGSKEDQQTYYKVK